MPENAKPVTETENPAQKHQVKFFVFVIESPSPVDLYHRRSEGDVIRQAVHLNKIPCTSVLAINNTAFFAALHVGLREAMEKHPGLIPILHISAHGSEEGIQLSDETYLSWDKLKEYITPINKAFGGGLFICMSTCNGYSGIRMAMTSDETEDAPFLALVGCNGRPTWPQTAVGFATLYHLIANGDVMTKAVEAMKIASGNPDFFVDTADSAKKSYLDYIKSINVETAREEIAETSEQTSNELEKALTQSPPQ